MARLLEQFSAALNQGDAAQFASLFDESVPAPELARYERELLHPAAVRRVVRDRARLPLADPAGREAMRVAIDVFEESTGDARLLTTSLVLHRAPGGEAWRIAGIDGVSAVDGLYRLRVETSTQYDLNGVTLSAPDFTLTFERGAAFAIDSIAGVTGIVFTGRGRLGFSPAPEAERLQVRLFSGEETLDDDFEAALVRFNPGDFSRLLPPDTLRAVPVDGRAARRAVEFAERELPASYVVDLGDLTTETWHLLPGVTDLRAEVRTGDHGTLTYARVGARAEDVSLVRRDRQLTIALYTSAARIPAIGRSYNESELREFDVLDYTIDARVGSGHQRLDAQAQMRLRALAPITALSLRLSDSLAVSRVSSPELGPLGFVRVPEQNAVYVRLPRELATGAEVTLEMAYAGRVRSQPLDDEFVQGLSEPAFWQPEPRLLLSASSDWYPQNPYVDHATATLRVTPPEGSTVVASGVPQPADTSAPNGTAGSRPSIFRAEHPLRYFAILVSRLSPVETRSLVIDGTGSPPLRIDVLANPLQRGPAREQADTMEAVLRFYAGLMEDVPYETLALAVVDAQLPGGHSPGYFVMLQNPLMTSPLAWRRDPAAFQGFPEFFLAHELAHQWWGQAIASKNYRERWISEGFAQYLAAMYAEHARGERMLHDMLKEFRRWAISESSMGPISLGGRLGHVEGGGQVFRALVYNKGAAVLHMLRRLVGDDVFVRGLRRFYHEHRFSVAGTDDLQRAFEAESGLSLERFFDGWIRSAVVPEVEVRTSIEPSSVHVTLEQTNPNVMDLPVTVSVVYRDDRIEDMVVVMTTRQVERTIATEGEVRRVEVNRDNAALAEFRVR